MGNRQHPAGLARSGALAIDHPTACQNAATDESIKLSGIETAQMLPGDMQDSRPLELEPHPATVTLDTLHPCTYQREARLREGVRRKNGRCSPEVTARVTGLPLGCLVALPEIDVGRLGNEVTKTFTKQRRFQIRTLVVVDMGQGTSVAIFRLGADLQPDAPATSPDPRLQFSPRQHGEGFLCPPATAELRRVQPDQPNAAPVGQAQGVAIHHPRHLDLWQGAGRRTGRLDRR